MPSSAIQVLWPWRMPCGFRPYLTGSQQATGMSSGIGRMPRPLGCAYGASSGGAGAQVVIGMPGHWEASAIVSRGGLVGWGWYRPSQAGRNTRRA
ncbi:MAG: hypothetical protein ACREPA_12725 [Candidatus Dormibacteraceae bacterium]